MPNRECPAKDGPLSPDPYQAGLVQCKRCKLRYHRPCISLFRKCAQCGRDLKTEPVFCPNTEQKPVRISNRESSGPAVKEGVVIRRRNTGSGPNPDARGFRNVTPAQGNGCLLAVCICSLAPLLYLLAVLF